jgi:ATP-binding cassette subfamily G (WHITE) protein 1/ATP-binding cassette subfamily G (WHITE) protein 2
VVELLTRLRGCTLLCTLHQPSPVLFGLFDSLLLLQSGGTAYWGAASAAEAHFALLGLSRAPGYGTAEYLVTLCGSGTDLVSLFSSSSSGAAARAAATASAAAAAEEDGYSAATPPRPTHGALRETALLLRLRGLARYRKLSYWGNRMLLPLLALVLVSTFYTSHGAAGDPQSFGKSNAIVFWTVTSPMFIGAIYVADFAEERPLYTRELADCLYRPASLVAYKLLTELCPLLISSGAYAAIVYPALGMRPGGAAFGFFALALLANQLICVTLCFALAAALPGAEMPLAVLPCYAMLNTLAAGYWVPAALITPIWRWLYSISFNQWLFSALMLNQYANMRFTASLSSLTEMADGVMTSLLPAEQAEFWEGTLQSATRLLGNPVIPGETVLATYGLMGRSKWVSLGWAALSWPVCLLLFYAGVRLVRHDRR